MACGIESDIVSYRPLLGDFITEIPTVFQMEMSASHLDQNFHISQQQMDQIFDLKRMIHESEETLAQKRGGYMNEESGRYDNTDNLYPVTYSEPSSYSIRLSYTAMNDYWGQ
jgi:hypothetical protein